MMDYKKLYEELIVQQNKLYQEVINEQNETIKLLETKVDLLEKTVEKVRNSNQGTVKKRDEMIEAKQSLELENRVLKEENEKWKILEQEWKGYDDY
jgi:uncharacterized protein YbaP (TraB family)